jgi:hypothetical protein
VDGFGLEALVDGCAWAGLSEEGAGTGPSAQRTPAAAGG